jgi:hypothetical protein
MGVVKSDQQWKEVARSKQSKRHGGGGDDGGGSGGGFGFVVRVRVKSSS